MSETVPLTLTRQQSRRFMLSHLGLLASPGDPAMRSVPEFLRRVGCIQYDPINVVARNPDLALQARFAGHRTEALARLLYQDRALLDGWDKMAAIYLREDWPYFDRHRRAMRAHHERRSPEAVAHGDEVLQAIRERGPLSSIDFKATKNVNWSWGRPVRLARAALQVLYESGEVGVHHRVGTRRYYDLVENLLPSALLHAPDPYPEDEDYQRWHLVRRIRSMGLAQDRAGVHWSGILGLDSRRRRKLIAALAREGVLRRVQVEGIPGRDFYLSSEDLTRSELSITGELDEPATMKFLAPLDNVLWDRGLIKLLFDFEYVWEVYKPADQRLYGFYVLPVLYGDRLVARVEPRLDRDKNILLIEGWWWEDGYGLDPQIQAALHTCLASFASFLGVARIDIQSRVTGLIGLDPIL